jgi:hypothetical protein
VEANKPVDPMEVGVLGAQAVMPQSDRRPHLIEELGLLAGGEGGCWNFPLG